MKRNERARLARFCELSFLLKKREPIDNEWLEAFFRREGSPKVVASLDRAIRRKKRREAAEKKRREIESTGA